MTNDERLQHNAEENGITIEQAKRLDHYMGMKMNQWPAVLSMKCDALANGFFCGEIAVAAICECLKSGLIE